MGIDIHTLHSYSPYEIKTVLLHLLPTSSKVKSRMQSAVPVVMDQPLVEVMICTFVTILTKFANHTAVLDPHINSPLVMSTAVNRQTTFLLVSASS